MKRNPSKIGLPPRRLGLHHPQVASRRRALTLESLEARTLLTLSGSYLELLQGAQSAATLGQQLATSKLANSTVDVPLVSNTLGDISRISDKFQNTFGPIVSKFSALQNDPNNKDAEALAYLNSSGLYQVNATPTDQLNLTFKSAIGNVALNGASTPKDLGFGGSNPYISKATSALFSGSVTGTASGNFSITFGVNQGGQFYLKQGPLFENARVQATIGSVNGEYGIRSLPFTVKLGGSAGLNVQYNVSLGQDLVGSNITPSAIVDATSVTINGSANLDATVTARILDIDMVKWTADTSWNLGVNPSDPGDPEIKAPEFLLDKASLTQMLVDRLVKQVLPGDVFGLGNWGPDVGNLMQVVNTAAQFAPLFNMLSAVSTGNYGNQKLGLADPKASPDSLATKAAGQANNDDSRWTLANSNDLIKFALGQNVDLVSYTYDPPKENLFSYNTPKVPIAGASFFGIINIVASGQGSAGVDWDYGLRLGLDTKGAYIDTDVTKFETSAFLAGGLNLELNLLEVFKVANAVLGMKGGPILTVGLRADAGMVNKRYVTAGDITGGLPALDRWLSDAFQVDVSADAKIALSLDVNSPIGTVTEALPPWLRPVADELLEAAGPVIDGAVNVAKKAQREITKLIPKEVCHWGWLGKKFCEFVGNEEVIDEAANALTGQEYLIILDAAAVGLGILDRPGAVKQERDSGFAFNEIFDHPGLFGVKTFGPTREKGVYTWSWDLIKPKKTLDSKALTRTTDPADNDPANDTIKYTFVNGVLSITGTDDKNIIQLIDVGNGTVQLQRRTILADGTVKDDVTLEFSGVTRVNASLLGDNDTFSMSPSLKIDAFIEAGAGNDTVTAGAGNDTIQSGTGVDTVTSGDGDDVITIEGTRGIVNAGKGNDTIYGGNGNDVLDAGPGFDFVSGGGGNNQIDGGDDDDTLYGGDGNDTISGGGGNDLIDTGGGRNTVYGGSGNDFISLGGTFNAAYGEAENDTIIGSAGTDYIYGGGGNDSLIGASGDDLLYGEAGDDTLDGGTGDDLLDGGGDNDSLMGGQGDDALDGGMGNDRLYGGEDSDSLTWSLTEGNDTIEGGTGHDTLALLGTDGVDFVRLLNGLSSLLVQYGTSAGATTDQARVNAVEFLVVQLGAGTDNVLAENLAGLGVASVFFNFGEDDAADLVTLRATGSDDKVSISAQELNDGINPTVTAVVVEGLAARYLVQQSTPNGDVLSVEGVDGDDTLKATAGVEALVGIRLDGGAGDDLLSADATLLGGDGSDTLIGGAGDDSLDGGAGDDVLFAGTGNNTLIGGAGNDTILVDGTDFADSITLSEAGGILAISVNGQAGSNIHSQVERIVINGTGGNDVIDAATVILPLLIEGGEGDDSIVGGTGADFLSGGRGNDTLLGLAGIDSLQGGEGNDSLIGGTGNDQVFGGDGSDAIVWNNGDGSDLIEGGEGADIAVVNGAAAGDAFTVAPNGARVKFDRTNLGLFSLDIAGIEQMNINSGTGGDTIAVSDLTGTEIKTIKIDLGAGDGAQDIVTLDGSSIADDLAITQAGLALDVTGLFARVSIAGSAAASDVLQVRGNGGDDRIKADPGVEAAIGIQLEGGAGNDYLSADATLLGGIGDDTLIGGTGPDVLLGGAGNDSIVAGTGDDLLLGDADGTGVGASFAVVAIASGHGNDSLSGGDGNDTLNGDLGDDSLGGDAGDDTIGPVTIGGVAFADPGNDTMRGGDGNDAINGDAGDDSIFGDAGNDSLLGGTGNDTIEGGTGDDTIEGGIGNDSVLAGAGFDSVSGGDGDDTLFGGDNEDTIFGNAGNDYLVGDAGNDSLDGGEGNDVLDGRDGNDTLLGQAGNDLILGQAGNDSIDGGIDNDTILGGEGDDSIVAGLGNDLALGDAGRDMLDGGDGNDTLDGGDGNDIVLGQAGDDWLLGGGGDDSLNGGTGNDTIHGGAGVDTLTGESGNDVLRGESDNDLLSGDDGGDDLDGGDGNDLLYGGTGNDTLQGGQGDDMLRSGDGDDIAFGGAGNDLIFGDDGEDHLSGGDGNDSIRGGIGNDTLVGDAGDDQVFGEAGLDFILGEDGNDVLDGGDSADTIRGGAGQDTITGDDGDDALLGDDGDDVIVAGPGNDSAQGGAGDDQVWGDAGDDVLSGDDGNDTLVGGDGNDNLLGGNGNDLLFGNADNDQILGGFGDDSIYGGIGDDVLHGGNGIPNVPHSVRDQTLPDDGADVILGGDGFDLVDGGTGNNLLDAGDDGIAETVLAGHGNDIAFGHWDHDGNRDTAGLDGGFNRVYVQGGLTEPGMPAEAASRLAFTVVIQPPAGRFITQPGDGKTYEDTPLPPAAIRRIRRPVPTPSPFARRGAVLRRLASQASKIHRNTARPTRK